MRARVCARVRTRLCVEGQVSGSREHGCGVCLLCKTTGKGEGQHQGSDPEVSKKTRPSLSPRYCAGTCRGRGARACGAGSPSATMLSALETLKAGWPKAATQVQSQRGGAGREGRGKRTMAVKGGKQAAGGSRKNPSGCFLPSPPSLSSSGSSSSSRPTQTGL